MINLPHQKPVRFVDKILEKNNDELVTSCIFPYTPSLAMVCEAAAQSTAGFDTQVDEIKIGFLVSLKDIECLKEFEKKQYLIKVGKSFNFGSMQEYKFELKDSINVYAKGFITISLQN